MYSIVIRRTYSPWWLFGLVQRTIVCAIEVPPFYEYASICKVAERYRAQYDSDEYSVSILEGDAKDAIAAQR